MKLSEIKKELKQLDIIAFRLPNGQLVSSHFHVTEIGEITKLFIDCGGTVGTEKAASFQLWEANDYDHRLHPEKLLNIIKLSERTLGIEDLEIEVEYQGQTIQKFGLDFDGINFLLSAKQTDCLAKDKYGIAPKKHKVTLSNIQNSNCCVPENECC